MDSNLKVSVNEYLPLRDIVFNSLRKAILKGELIPGERLMEKQLAEKMGVSRTPIREAIRKLELEGLVIMVPRKGAEVAMITEQDITDVLEVRAALESFAVKMACSRMDQQNINDMLAVNDAFMGAAKRNDVETVIKKDVEFHDTIYRATGNKKLIAMITNLQEQIYRFRVEYIRQMDDFSTLMSEHEEIVNAIVNKDSLKAQEVATQHIENQEKAVISKIALE